MKNKKFLTTSEVSELLNINEKKIYILAQEGIIPATKITGKWLFPYDELVYFLRYESLKNLKKGITFSLLENNILIGAGSDDPILSKIFNHFYNFSKTTLFYSTVGSKNGVNMLKNKVVHFAFSHLYDFKKNEFNLPYLKDIFTNNDYVVINLFHRDIGVVSSFEFSNLEELNKKNLTFILRQKGSGIRNITENIFESDKLKRVAFKFFPNEVTTHIEVANLVKNNKEFIGITTKSTAKIFDLYFHKIFKERFDLITLKEYFFNKIFQQFYNFIIEKLKKELSPEGYDFKECGKIII
jgi:excisionase family DNA binding protein